MTDVFCALAALEAGEPLIGTAAADTDRWLLLEDEGAWASKPLKSEGLAVVRDQLAAWDAAPRHRLQLIRRPDRSADGPVRLYVGFSGGTGPWLLSFDLHRLEALGELDLEAVAREGAHPNARRVEGPLHLVCTHGKRDRCCAKWGMPVFQALSDAGADVWQTSHTGGHRFAANVISFPHGVTYGRVAPDEAAALVDAHGAGRLHALDRLRGRNCYDAPTQVAELALRRRTGDLALDALRHLGTEPAGEDRWQVRFEHAGDAHVLAIAREETGLRRPKSCGDPPTPLDRYVALFVDA